MPSRTQITELNCEEGWSYIAAWTGVQLSLILHLVGASPKAMWVVFYPSNDFWGSIDMPEALHPQTLLAYGMNGEDLTPITARLFACAFHAKSATKTLNTLPAFPSQTH